MKSRQPKVLGELRELFLDPSMSQFNFLEFRDAYLYRFGLGPCSNSSELRQWLYRRILVLVKRGHITKEQSSSEPSTIYKVTDQFKKTLSDQLPKSSNEIHEISEKEFQLSPRSDSLRAKLNQYKVDMLSYIGECKEYKQLITEFPQLKQHIEPMYREAQERSSELMGKLRAINNLLEMPELPK
jgi:hypothetical protein